GTPARRALPTRRNPASENAATRRRVVAASKLVLQRHIGSRVATDGGARGSAPGRTPYCACCAHRHEPRAARVPFIRSPPRSLASTGLVAGVPLLFEHAWLHGTCPQPAHSALH